MKRFKRFINPLALVLVLATVAIVYAGTTNLDNLTITPTIDDYYAIRSNNTSGTLKFSVDKTGYVYIGTLSGTMSSGTISSTTISNPTISGTATLSSATLSGGGTLSGTFKSGTLSGNTISNPTISGVATMSSATFSGGGTFSGIYDGGSFSSPTIINATHSGTSLWTGPASQTALSGYARFDGTLAGGTLSGNTLRNIMTLTSATLSGGATLSGTFTGGTISGTTLSNITLSGTTIPNMSGVTMTTTTLSGTTTLSSGTLSGGGTLDGTFTGGTLSNVIIGNPTTYQRVAYVRQVNAIEVLSGTDLTAGILIVSDGSGACVINAASGAATKGQILVVRNQGSSSTLTVKVAGATGVAIASGNTAVLMSPSGLDWVRVSADAAH